MPKYEKKKNDKILPPYTNFDKKGRERNATTSTETMSLLMEAISDLKGDADWRARGPYIISFVRSGKDQYGVYRSEVQTRPDGSIYCTISNSGSMTYNQTRTYYDINGNTICIIKAIMKFNDENVNNYHYLDTEHVHPTLESFVVISKQDFDTKTK